jgi:hypothetical protein
VPPAVVGSGGGTVPQTHQEGPSSPVTSHRSRHPNAPRFALTTALVLIGGAAVGFTVAKDTQSLAIVVAATVPSLLAAAFAERASRDIRNGTVTEKAREGAVEALQETGVVQAVEDGKQTTPAALTALIMLLSDRLELDAEERADLAKPQPPKKKRKTP